MQNYKQFIIIKDDSKLIPPDSFCKKKLDGYNFFYQKDLTVYSSEENKILLVGLAYQTDINRKNPISELMGNCTDADIISKISSWSGRWILIYNNKIYLDATGNLQCFYDEVNLVISNSLSLIKNTVGSKSQTTLKNTCVGDMDWFPGPNTKYNNITRLLSSQVISLSDSLIIDELHYKPYFDKFLKDMGYEDIISEVVSMLKTLMANIYLNYEGEILLPLTSGYDSRTLLSACLNAEIKFSTYTFERENIEVSDIKIPQLISKKFGFKHKTINIKNPIDRNKFKDFGESCDYEYNGVDRLYYSRGQFDEVGFTNGKKLILRGGIWEFSRQFYLLKGSDITSMESSLKFIFKELQSDSVRFKSIKNWLSKRSNWDYNFSNQFYYDQRAGCWLASIEQALDITGYDRIHPINCRKLLFLLDKISVEKKSKGEHQKDIIFIMESKLLDFPFNRKSVFDFVNKIRKLGFKRTIFKLYIKFNKL